MQEADRQSAGSEGGENRLGWVALPRTVTHRPLLPCPAPPHLAADLRARQLSVVDLDIVPRHGRLHQDQRVGGNLVPQPAAPAVDHDANLEGGGGGGGKHSR